MKKCFTYFVYLSIVFLIITLFRGNLLEIPEIHNFLFLFISLILLFASFSMQFKNWQNVLKQGGFVVSNSDAFISVSLPVMGKYIPGKLWLIIGRVSYIAEKYRYNVKKLVPLSTTTQIIALWSGLTTGILGVFLLNIFDKFQIVAFLLWLMLSLFIFTSYPYVLLEKITYLILKKKIAIPVLSFRQTIEILPLFFGYWTLTAFSFTFLILSLGYKINLLAGFIFPMSAVLGMLAVISPGGLGIREGILILCLKLLGFELDDATTISLASRIWFLVGEIFLFTTGLTLSSKSKKN